MALFFDTLAKGLDFSGRASRKEFWVYLGCVILIGVPLVVLDVVLGWFNPDIGLGPLAGVYLIILFIPNTAVTVRRLHDSNRSGWWFLVGLIPFVGPFIQIGHMLIPGTAGPNQYGEDPLGREPVPTDDDPA